ncbi:MAG TPA: YceI family protein [Mucilaginibacter sp.]|jgi:polyisoprenoid-binding protein YceI|nr:YceI family protein [Mucilaginibacter sp.]
MTTNSSWKIDAGHSQVQFKVKHLAITNVNGVFNTFEGTVECVGDDFDQARVKASIAVDSIDTKHPDRDKHLKSPDFFDVANHPFITFDGVLQKEGGDYQLTGDLSIKGVQQPVTLDVEFTGAATGRFGDQRAGFEASGKISRKDFGLTWNILAEGGGLVLGDEIKLNFDIQLLKQ